MTSAANLSVHGTKRLITVDSFRLSLISIPLRLVKLNFYINIHVSCILHVHVFSEDTGTLTLQTLFRFTHSTNATDLIIMRFSVSKIEIKKGRI